MYIMTLALAIRGSLSLDSILYSSILHLSMLHIYLDRYIYLN